MEVNMENFKFTLILSVYKNDNFHYFKDAVESCLNQTCLPDQFIIIVDGPIDQIFIDQINHYKLAYVFIESIYLNENMGRGFAKNYAIERAKNEFIAIMDSDDLCVPNRFELQAEFLKRNPDVDIVGSYIEEFKNSVGDLNAIRKVKLSHHDILMAGKYRQSMNHVTLMFRKKVYTAIDGYSTYRYTEDFHFLTKLLIYGARFANIPKVLVIVRVAPNQFLKRTGYKYFKEEVSVFRLMYEKNFIGIGGYIFNFFVRVIFRFSPPSLLNLFYKYYLRN
jgi:glycosyltransferase involved in cell wall biosynthesis